MAISWVQTIAFNKRRDLVLTTLNVEQSDVDLFIFLNSIDISGDGGVTFTPNTALPDFPQPTLPYLFPSPGLYDYYVNGLVHNHTYQVRYNFENATDGSFFSQTYTFTTGNYPTFRCGDQDITDTTARLEANATSSVPGTQWVQNTGDLNENGLSTVSGGPYTYVQNNGGTAVHTYTGLTPNTTYYYRWRVTEFHESNGIIAISEECSFTTLVAPGIKIDKVTTTLSPVDTNQPITSTITVKNESPTTTTRNITDPIPSSPPGNTRSYTSVSSGGATGNTPSGTTGINDNVTLPPNSRVVYTIVDKAKAGGVYRNATKIDNGVERFGGDPIDVNPPIDPVPTDLTNSSLVKLCSQVNITKLCDSATDIPILLVTIASSDGDVIPVDSVEFPVGTGYGVYSTIGFMRSYYTGLNGVLLSPQPTLVSSQCSSGSTCLSCRN